MKKSIILILLCACLVGCGKTKEPYNLYLVRISDLEGGSKTVFAESIYFDVSAVVITDLDGTEYTTSYSNVVIEDRMDGK